MIDKTPLAPATGPIVDSAEWLRVTLSSIGDAVITTDAQATVTFLNPIAERLTGWSQDDASGVPIERVFHIIDEETRQESVNPCVHVLRGGVSAELANHTILISKDGTEWHIDDSAAPIRNTAGVVVGVVLVFRDIGPRRVLERQKAAALEYAEAILDTMRHPFLVLDARLVVKSASVSFYRWFQTSESETLGRSVYALGDGQWNIPALRALLEEILPSESSFEDFELEHDFPKLGRRNFALNSRRIDDGESEAEGLILLTMEDVTDRKRMGSALRDSEVRYRRLFQTAKDGILIIDAVTGRIIDANAFIAGLTGYELAELRGKALHEIGLISDAAANRAMFHELQECGYVRYENLPIHRKNGETAEVEFISNVYREKDGLVAQCNIRDISARVAMERQIKDQTLALADQHRRKDEFLAMLSHELRNPLAPIRSATHLLRLQERGTENLIAQQAREVIERQVAHLTRLVSDLLEVSRVVSGRIHLQCETVDFCQAVRHGLETVGPLIARQCHELLATFPSADAEPLWVSADPTRLEQIIVNLLTNSAKFTSAGGRIWVSVALVDHSAVLTVRDSGIGIGPEMLPHVFDLFAQADRSLDRAQGGLGIGLSVVQKLIELHGGTVSAQSDGLNTGSEFTVRLPAAAAPGERTSAVIPGARPHEVHQRRILIVDDSVDTCAVLASILGMQGYSVRVVHTGPHAITDAKSWRPDVMLLDIGLPELDGYQVAQRLRTDPDLKDMKIVGISGYGSPEDVQLAIEAGFDAQLLKPVDPEEIETLLASWDPQQTA